MGKLLLLWLVLLAGVARAAVPWEVGVVFLGAKDDDEFQADMDRNILDLTRLTPGPGLRLTLYREFPRRAVQFTPDPKSSKLHAWNPLFHKMPVKVEVSGEMAELKRGDDEPSILTDDKLLDAFFKAAFVDVAAKRLLILHGHGEGYEGMRVISLVELKNQLVKRLPARKGKPLDLLWLDACFMASTEVAVEMKDVAHRLLGSEEAEFSAGGPFDALGDLLKDGPENVDKVARGLAERFLESYSFTEEGRRTGAVLKSSATISVIDPERLEKLLPVLKEIATALKGLPGGWKEKVNRRARKFKTDRADLVDLGSLLLDLRTLKLLPATKGTPLKQLISDFEIDGEGALQTNPRVKVEPSKEDSRLVYGYEKWTRGHREDEEVIDKLPANLKPKDFVAGPRKKDWPFRIVHKRLYLTPFTVGLNSFHYYFEDDEKHAVTVTRERDFVTYEAGVDENPILFDGYTQGIGATAERYSGLNVLLPTQGIPYIPYMDTHFYDVTRWANF